MAMSLCAIARHLAPPWKRVPVLLGLLYSFSLSAYSQQITLSFEQTPLEEVFRQIETKTAYRFVYAREELQGARPVTLTVRSRNIQEILSRVFAGQPLSFSFSKNYISVRRKEEPKEPAPAILQSLKVTGQVLSEEGEPLAGASVTVRDRALATTADESGRFSLVEVPPSATLVVSSVGYEEAEIPLGGRTYLEITLPLSISTLDETVVIAYGKTTRRLNTGSVGRVSARTISHQPVSHPLAALAGRVPGLFITQGNGLPGSNFSVLVRGRNSIQNGSSPLYIIDGVPFLSDADRLPQRSGLNANSPFHTLPPGDIESIEVLKDADATAIYGSRGAGGVILITTRKPKEGKGEVSLLVASGMGRPTRTLDYMNRDQYLQMRREAFRNDGVLPDAANAPDLLLWDTTREVDWKEVLMGEPARTTNVHLTLSGGGPATRLYLGANYYKETTVFSGGSGNRRTALTATLQHGAPSKKWSATLTAGYGSDHSTLPLQNMGQYLNTPPHALDVYDSTGSLNWSEGGEYFGNPVALLRQTYRGEAGRLTSNLTVEYAISPSLGVTTSLGYSDVRFDERSAIPISSKNPAGDPKGEASFGTNVARSWLAEPRLMLRRPIGKKGKVQALAGFTVQERKNSSTLVRGTQYTSDALLHSTAGAGQLTASGEGSVYRYVGFFGRLNYHYAEKYLVTLTGRRDGSSRFGPGRQFANFGAVGAAWIFTKEKGLALPFLSYGKLRGSYGLTGSDQILNYQYLDSWLPTQYGYAGEPGFRPSRLYNPDYSWEQIQKLEAALEMGFFRDRLLLSLAWFRNLSDNQIIGYSLPDQTGFTSVLHNSPARVGNRGWEIELAAVPLVQQRFRWTASLHLTVPHNELLRFPGLETSPYKGRYQVGKPLNGITGYRYLGVNGQTGIYRFEDRNQNGRLDSDQSDYTYLGTTDPRFYGGLQHTLQLRGWELSILVEARRQLGLDPIAGSSALNGDLSNRPSAVLHRWQKQGDRAAYQRYSQDYDSPQYEAAYALSLSDAALCDASFVRLKSLHLSYSLPEGVWSKAGIRKARLFVQGQNLATWTRYRGADPENQSLVGLPPLRLMAGGVQVTF